MLMLYPTPFRFRFNYFTAPGQHAGGDWPTRHNLFTTSALPSACPNLGLDAIYHKPDLAHKLNPIADRPDPRHTDRKLPTTPYTVRPAVRPVISPHPLPIISNNPTLTYSIMTILFIREATYSPAEPGFRRYYNFPWN